MSAREIASFKFGPAFLVLGLVTLILGAAMLAAHVPGHVGATLLGFGITYLFLASGTVVRMYSDRMRLGIGGARVVKYVDVDRVERKGKLFVLHRIDGGKPWKFSAGLLRREDAERFRKLLDQKVAEAHSVRRDDAARPDMDDSAFPVAVQESGKPDMEQGTGQERGQHMKKQNMADIPKETVFNGKIVASLIINSLIVLLVSIQPSGPGMYFGAFMGTFVVLSLIGLFLLKSGNRKIGYALALVGFGIFVPIGLIGMIGVNQYVGSVNQS